MGVWASRIRSEKLRGDWYRRRYTRSPEGRRVEVWNLGERVCCQLKMKRQKKDVWKFREEKRKVRRCIYQSKKKVNK